MKHFLKAPLFKSKLQHVSILIAHLLIIFIYFLIDIYGQLEIIPPGTSNYEYLVSALQAIGVPPPSEPTLDVDLLELRSRHKRFSASHLGTHRLVELLDSI